MFSLPGSYIENASTESILIALLKNPCVAEDKWVTKPQGDNNPQDTNNYTIIVGYVNSADGHKPSDHTGSQMLIYLMSLNTFIENDRIGKYFIFPIRMGIFLDSIPTKLPFVVSKWSHSYLGMLCRLLSLNDQQYIAQRFCDSITKSSSKRQVYSSAIRQNPISLLLKKLYGNNNCTPRDVTWSGWRLTIAQSFIF